MALFNQSSPSEANNLTKTDFYPMLLDNNIYRTISLALSIGSVIIGVPFLLSVIWFDKFGSDKKRTILNLLSCRSVYIGIMFIFFVQIPEIARYIYGPLPSFICFGQQVLRTTLVIIIVLFADAMAALRYIFIFWIKNPAAFHDDFWCSFISSWIYGFCTMFCGSWYYRQNYQTFGFYICTGQDSKALLNNTNVGTTSLLVLSFMFNAFAYIKIYIYKKTPTVKPLSRGLFLKSLMLNQMDKQSLSTFSTRLVMIFNVSLSALNLYKLNGVTTSTFNVYPNYLNAYYRSFVTPTVAILFIMFWFLRQSNFRKNLANELRNFKDNF
jgi:hypothetical protein